jgi:hypothetical protein
VTAVAALAERGYDSAAAAVGGARLAKLGRGAENGFGDWPPPFRGFAPAAGVAAVATGFPTVVALAWFWPGFEPRPKPGVAG